MIYKVTNQHTCLELFTPYKLAKIEDILDYFVDKSIIEVDTETQYCTWNKDRLADPYTSKALSLQLGDYENQYVIDLLSGIDITPLIPLFEDSTKVKLFCNAFFDLRYFHHWGIRVVNIWDIFLVESCIHKGKTLPEGFRSLKGMSQRYLGINRDKAIRDQIGWRGLDVKVLVYAAEDVQYMNMIREKQIEHIKLFPVDITRYVNLENRYVYDLSLLSYNGIYVDPEKWLDVEKSNKIRLEELRIAMGKWLEENKLFSFLENTLWGWECEINWNSSKQVIKLLKALGINTLVRDKEAGGDAMKDSTDLKNLKKQTSKSTFLPLYIEYKELGKEISTYGSSFLTENVNPETNRIHSEFFQILDTSRISSNKPNMQNIPSVDNFGHNHALRKSFTAQKGKKLIDCDFSQQEPRITADFCQDPVLLDFVLRGDGDSHSFVSTLISEKLLGTHVVCNKQNNPIIESFGKRLRDIGKMINLGLK